MSVFDKVKEELKTDPDFVCLTQTTELKKIKHAKLRSMLAAMYESNKVGARAAATIVNAVYTGKKTPFILSKRIAQRLISEDCNHVVRPSLNNKEAYGSLIKALTGTLEFKIEVDHNDRRPAIWSLQNEEFISILRIDMFEEVSRIRMEGCLEFISRIDQLTGEKLNNVKK